MTEPLYTLARIREAGDRLQQHADEGLRALNVCNPVWIGAVWHCKTHDTYIEDGNVCPEADPVWDGLP